MKEINEQTQHMGIKGGHHRPELKNKDDVLKTIQNLCFCWVGFHSHTFSDISTGLTKTLRPPMLKNDIPTN